MRKILALFSAAALVACAVLPAAASPVPYVNVPLDTVNASINTAVASINSSQAPAATLTTVTGANGTLVVGGLRFSATITGLTTAASTAASATTITNASVTASSVVHCGVTNYAGTYVTNGIPIVVGVQPAAGSLTFYVLNVATANALSGNITVSCMVYN